MKIGLTGSISVGKTTLVKELSKLPQFVDYKIFTERSKYLRDMGIKLNTDSTVLGQMVFSSERSLELMNENMITDRSIWDVCAFTNLATSISNEEKFKLINSFMLIKDYYDVIIYVSPEGVDIEDNNVRETNPEYRNNIDKEIKRLLLLFPPKKLIKISGSVDERIKNILSELNI